MSLTAPIVISNTSVEWRDMQLPTTTHLQQLTLPDQHNNAHQDRMTVEKYNILIIGETQSGKSTLVQGLKRYANPGHVVERTYIGNNVNSHTTECQIHEIETCMPLYTAIGNREDNDINISLDGKQDCHNQETCNCSSEDYMDHLNQRGVRVEPWHKEENRYRFRLIDTPGLNDTKGRDEPNILEVYNAIQNNGPIHLVLVTIPPVPFTPLFKKNLKTYFHVFEELKDKVRFIHTKSDYLHRHHSHRDKLEALRLRKSELDLILGQSVHSHFTIDCDLATKRSVRICITQVILHDILRQALASDPITLNDDSIRKTPSMIAIDNVIAEQLYREDAESDETRMAAAKEEGVIYGTLSLTKKVIAEILAKQKDAAAFIHERNRESPKVAIGTHKFSEGYSFLPGGERSYTFGPQEHTIDEVRIFYSQGVAIKSEEGGNRHNYYRVNYTKHFKSVGSLEVHLLARPDHLNREQIARMEGVRSTCESIMVILNDHEKRLLEKIEEGMRYKEERKYLGLVRQGRVSQILFRWLAEVDYTKDPKICIEDMRAVYRRVIGHKSSEVIDLQDQLTADTASIFTLAT
ncbi:hypothetical protein BGW38_007787 [Lunasporangiospora selenospora]|uniref:G domain-containing protein n=1 Tax=Lunasporangiospora selenospora TaxID=979761 RepID=A0A9P6KGG8_9FUNG|nr:hypothetical protein BGW38_007787 [Lunasporangiospora selenospora]